MADNAFPILPQFQGDYLDAQRKMALAQALQQQALSGPQGMEGWNSMRIVPRMNPLSGLAGVGQALLANKAYGNAIDAQRQLGQEQFGAIQGMFQGGQPQANQGGQGSPQGFTPAGQGNVPGTTGSPMNPAGLPSSMAAINYLRDPNKYTEQFVAPYYKPTEATLLARQSGGDVAQANAGALAKANYIAPSEARPGGFTLIPDGRGGFTRMFNPNIPQGGVPVTDAQGNVVGATPLPGASQVEQGMAFAKALPGAQLSPIAGVDANGNPTYTTQAAASGFGPSGGAMGGSMFPGYTSPNGGQGNVRPGLPAGSGPLIDAAVDRFNQGQQAAANAPADIQALSNIQKLSTQAKTGVGFDRKAYLESMASIIPGIGPNADDATIANELGKWQAQIAGRVGGRSDAALENALHGTPGSQMTPAAIQNIVPSLIGLRRADLGKSTAATNWMGQHGGSPASLIQFEKQWNNTYDPDIYRLQSMSPDQQRAEVMKMTPQQRQALNAKRNSLVQMGALDVTQ